MLAAFLVGLRASPGQLQAVLWLLVGGAFAQTVVGLLQIGSPAAAFLYFGQASGRAVGTFANPNHLANFIAMAITAYPWLAWMRLRHGPKSALPSARARTCAAWAAGAVLFLVGVLMSRSRGALPGGLPPALAAIALALRLGPRARPWRTPVVVLATLVAAIALVGLHAVLARFELQGLASDAAFRMWLAASTMEGAAQFWPWGAGWDTYAAVFPRFQPPEVAGSPRMRTTTTRNCCSKAGCS